MCLVIQASVSILTKKHTIHILWLNGKTFAKINWTSNSMLEGLHTNQYKLDGFYAHLIPYVTAYFIVTDVDLDFLVYRVLYLVESNHLKYIQLSRFAIPYEKSHNQIC